LIGIELEEFKLVYLYISRYFNDNVFMTAHTKFLLYCETRGNKLEKNFAYQENVKKKKKRNKAK